MIDFVDYCGFVVYYLMLCCILFNEVVFDYLMLFWFVYYLMKF